VITSNLGPISHRFRDIASYSLKLSIKIAIKPYLKWRYDYYWQVIGSILYDGTIADPLRLTVWPQYRTTGIP